MIIQFALLPNCRPREGGILAEKSPGSAHLEPDSGSKKAKFEANSTPALDLLLVLLS
jgi:hypothetical protein